MAEFHSTVSYHQNTNMMLPLTWQQNDDLFLSLNVKWIIKIHYFMDFLPLLLLEALEAMDVTRVKSQISASHEFTDFVFMT